MALVAADNAAAAAGGTAFSLPGVLFDVSGSPTAASAMENATASASPSCAAKSTPNRTSPWYSAIFTAAGLASNIFALVVVARAARRTRSRSRGAFLAVVTGLVATDLAGLAVTGAVVVSMHALDLEWTRVDPRRHLCRFFGGCMVFFGLSPLLLGCAMAVERRLGVARPLVHAAIVTRRGAGAAVLAAWALALAVAVAPAAGLGSYSVQWPGSWCFLATEGADGGVLQPAHAAGAVCFSLLGLVSLAASHLFNSTTVLTLVRARRCGAGAGAGAGARRRHRANKHELEMVVQLLGIMVIATVCWTPLLVFIANIALKSSLIPAERHCSTLILGIRMATWNQILDPWVYILFRRSVMLRLCPGLGGGAGGGGGGTAASSVRSASAASVSMAVYGAALRSAASVKGAPEGAVVAAVAAVTPPRGRAAVMPAVNGGGRGGGGGGGGGGDTGGGRGRRDGGDGRGGGGGETEESRL